MNRLRKYERSIPTRSNPVYSEGRLVGRTFAQGGSFQLVQDAQGHGYDVVLPNGQKIAGRGVRSKAAAARVATGIIMGNIIPKGIKSESGRPREDSQPSRSPDPAP